LTDLGNSVRLAARQGFTCWTSGTKKALETDVTERVLVAQDDLAAAVSVKRRGQHRPTADSRNWRSTPGDSRRWQARPVAAAAAVRRQAGERLAQRGKRMTLRIDSMRQKLLGRRAALFRAVAHVEDDLRWLDTNVEPEVEEEGQEENIARLLARLDERGKAEIEAVDAALGRIASGNYGRCAACGGPIPPARLDAMPTATTCVRCAQRRERGTP
jgi:DnaK suppressor protein